MPSPLAEINRATLRTATVDFMAAHLGHLLTLGTNGRGNPMYLKAHRMDEATGTFYRQRAQGPIWKAAEPPKEDRVDMNYVLRHEALTCTECHVSREWTHAHAAILAALKTLAEPYLAGASSSAEPSGEAALRDAIAMARLIADL